MLHDGDRVAHITPTVVDSGTYDAQARMLSGACTRTIQSSAGAHYIYTANGDLREKIAGTDTTKYTGVYPALAGTLLET